MSDLSPDARAIVDAARPAGHGTDADRERVRTALRLRLLAAASVSSSSSDTAPRSNAPLQSVVAGSGGKYVAVLVLAAVVAAALVWRSRGQHSNVEDAARYDDAMARPSTRTFTVPFPATPMAIEPAPPTAIAPLAVDTVAAPTAVLAEPASARREHGNAAPRAAALAHAALPPTSEVVAVEPVPAPAPPDEPPAAPIAEPASRSTLADETRRLDEARNALRTNPHNALELLDEWNAIRPNGELREERRAQRVAALCALGRVDGARLEADRLLEEAPRSPQAGRVRQSCAFTGR